MDAIRTDDTGSIVFTSGAMMDNGTKPPRGQMVIRDDSLPCDKNDNCSCDNTQKNCAGDSTCNNFCNSSRKDFSLSECSGCDCPCPGRLNFPHCWAWNVTGSLTTEEIADSDNPGYYYKLLSDPSYSFNECTPDLSAFGSYTWGYFDPTGTQVGTSTNGNLHIIADLGLAINDGTTPSVYVVDLQITAAFGNFTGPGNGSGGVTNFGPGLNNNWVGGIGIGAYGYNAHQFVNLPPCTGGTATGSTDANAYWGYFPDGTPIYANQNPGVGGQPPVAVVAPKCRQCDGSICPVGSTPASSCACATLTMDVYQGMTEELDDHGDPVLDGDGNPIMIPLYVPFTGTYCGGCGGSAFNNGMTVTIAMVTPCTLVDSTDGQELNPTWQSTLVSDAGDIVFETSGYVACPYFYEAVQSTTIDNGSYDLIQDVSFTYGTDC